VGVSNRKEQPYIAAERAAAIESFYARYGREVAFAPILVVVAAYNEHESLDEVLTHIPCEVSGLDVDTLVVDDGSTDSTGMTAEVYPRVRLVRLERNCGHGVALRLGYQLAAEHGSRYIVTLDGDMQWDPREMPTMLAPLLKGEADLVIGSRALGTAETDDSFRHAGVRLFAALVSLITGVKVTDTSSGYRAMRTEVTQTVPQTQVQYQTSELLIGAIYAGYLVTEVPITMHKRFAGESKKGHNLLYGMRYARVIMETWWRERARSRRQGRRVARRIAR
jgi:glycosyltransferase involved in cell wall biosynthesis